MQTCGLWKDLPGIIQAYIEGTKLEYCQARDLEGGLESLEEKGNCMERKPAEPQRQNEAHCRCCGGLPGVCSTTNTRENNFL